MNVRWFSNEISSPILDERISRRDGDAITFVHLYVDEHCLLGDNHHKRLANGRKSVQKIMSINPLKLEKIDLTNAIYYALVPNYQILLDGKEHELLILIPRPITNVLNISDENDSR